MNKLLRTIVAHFTGQRNPRPEPPRNIHEMLSANLQAGYLAWDGWPMEMETI